MNECCTKRKRSQLHQLQQQQQQVTSDKLQNLRDENGWKETQGKGGKQTKNPKKLARGQARHPLRMSVDADFFIFETHTHK